MLNIKKFYKLNINKFELLIYKMLYLPYNRFLLKNILLPLTSKKMTTQHNTDINICC